MKRKNSGLDLQHIQPQTPTQESAFNAFASGKNLLMTGPAGVGKTIIAMYLALGAVMRRQASKLVIIRSVVPSRDIGFMPGGLKDKVALYETPYIDTCALLYGRDDAYDCLRSCRQLEFITTSFVRGTTIRDAIVFLDEGENLSFHECDTVITRVGENSRIIVCGDVNQSDLTRSDERQGFQDFSQILHDMNTFYTVEFSIEDVQRSDIVREYLEARRRVLKW